MAITFINGLLIVTLLTGVFAVAACLKARASAASGQQGSSDEPGHKAVLAGLTVIFLTWFGYLLYLLDMQYQDSCLSVIRPSAAGYIVRSPAQGVAGRTKYRYAVAGFLCQGTIDGGAADRHFDSGSVVRVYYNPEIPLESSLKNGSNLAPDWSLLILPALLGSGCLLLLIPGFKNLRALLPRDRLTVVVTGLILGISVVGCNPYVRLLSGKWFTQIMINSQPDAADIRRAQDLKSMALLCLQSGEYQEAAAHLKKAADLFAAKGQPIEAASALGLLGQTRESQGDLTQAQSSYRQALNVLSGAGQALSSTNQAQILPETVDGLAIDYQISGNFGQAIRAYVEGLHLERAYFGKTSLRIAQTLINLADLLQRQNELDRAASDYGQAVDILKTSVSTNDPRITYCLDNVARIFFEQGKLLGSQTLYRSVVAAWNNADPDSLQLGLSLKNYSRLLKVLQKDDEAQLALTRANRILANW